MKGEETMSEVRLIDANAYREKAGKHWPEEWLDILGDMPTIDPVKHGKWIDTERYSKKLWMTIHKTVCSVCKESHEELPLGEWKFCPNCGARMDGEA